MSSDCKYVCKFVADDKSAHGVAVGNTFGHGKCIRNDSEALISETGAETSHTALHLIAEHEDIVFIAELAHLFEIFGVGRKNSAFALNHFKHYSADIWSDRRFQCFDIVERNLFETGHIRLKTLAVF